MRRCLSVFLVLSICGCRGSPAIAHLPSVTHATTAAVPSDSASNEMCRGITNGYQCAQRIERSLLAETNPIVVRSGADLRIAFGRGSSVVLTDSAPGNDTGVRYSYRGMLTAVGYHLVHEQYHEGERYLLVNRSTGWTSSSNGVPIVSSDSVRLAASNLDLDAGYSPTTLQIWRVVADSLIVEFEHDFARSHVPADSVWGPRKIEWRTPTELRIERAFLSGASGGTARVVRSADHWRILIP